jgi:hypothetical protein
MGGLRTVCGGACLMLTVLLLGCVVGSLGDSYEDIYLNPDGTGKITPCGFAR